MQSLSSRPAWSTEKVPGQPGLHSETLSQKEKNKTKQKQKQDTSGLEVNCSVIACSRRAPKGKVHLT